MSTVNQNGQSYLEMQGADARAEQTARSDYNANNEYNETHPDALATGDAMGKGTGDFAGHGHSVPDMTKPKSQMAYGNFNTWEGGNDCDNQARTVMLARSLYGPDRQYGLDVKIDTSKCEGQFHNDPRARIKAMCKVV